MENTNKMHKYVYEGPVYHFEHIINNKYKDHTTAVSKKRALVNITFKAKVRHGYARNAKIILNEKYLQIIEE